MTVQRPLFNTEIRIPARLRAYAALLVAVVSALILVPLSARGALHLAQFALHVDMLSPKGEIAGGISYFAMANLAGGVFGIILPIWWAVPEIASNRVPDSSFETRIRIRSQTRFLLFAAMLLPLLVWPLIWVGAVERAYVLFGIPYALAIAALAVLLVIAAAMLRLFRKLRSVLSATRADC